MVSSTGSLAAAIISTSIFTWRGVERRGGEPRKLSTWSGLQTEGVPLLALVMESITHSAAASAASFESKLTFGQAKHLQSGICLIKKRKKTPPVLAGEWVSRVANGYSCFCFPNAFPSFLSSHGSHSREMQHSTLLIKQKTAGLWWNLFFPGNLTL